MSEQEVVRVRDVMKPEFDMVEGMSTVADALEKMQYVDTKTLIVNKRHDDDEYGIVLFSDIAKRVAAHQRDNPDQQIIKLGIGDVTRALPAACIQAFHQAVDEMAHRTTLGRGNELTLVKRGVGDRS